MDMKDLLRKVDGVATLSVVANSVLEELASPECTAKSISDIISKDPILSTKIIKTANSSLFGFLFKASNIESAVTRLGINRVRSITVAMGVGSFFRGKKEIGGYSPIRLWEHSVGVGIMAELIACNGRRKEVRELSGEALLAGLVHDLGIILEDQFLPNDFPSVVLEAQKQNMPIFRAEMQRLGFQHAMFGSSVLRRWRIPSLVCDAVEKHHESFNRQDHILTHIVMMSEILASAADVGFHDVATFPRTEFGLLQNRLALVGQVFNNIRDQFKERMDEALTLFGVNPEGGSSSYSDDSDTEEPLA